jgi:hypothetical protein
VSGPAGPAVSEPSSRATTWKAMIWIGLAVPAAVVAFTAVRGQLGSAVLFLGVPLAVAGVLAWLGTHGVRLALWLLVPISLLAALVGGVYLFVARAFAGELGLGGGHSCGSSADDRQRRRPCRHDRVSAGAERVGWRGDNRWTTVASPWPLPSMDAHMRFHGG